jgi:hypothetical protein
MNATNFIERMICHVHNNPEFPENMNIKKMNIRDNYLSVYEEGKWQRKMYKHAIAETGRQLADNIAQRFDEEETLPKLAVRHEEIFDEAILFIDDLQPAREEPSTNQKEYMEHLKPILHKG